MTCVKLIYVFLFFLRRLLLGWPFLIANLHAPCVALPGFRGTLPAPLLRNALSCAPPVPAALGAAKILPSAIPNSVISHPEFCHQSSQTLPIVIPNSANSHPELDSGSLYRLHPNTESSCLKLTSRRSLSPVEGPCKKKCPVISNSIRLCKS